MPEIRTGVVAFVDGGQADPHLINVAAPIDRLKLRLTGNAVVTVTVALNEDGILRLVRRIQVTKGGVPLKIIGNNAASGAAFRLYNPLNRFLYSGIPELAQPALTAGTNAFSATINIPFALPPTLYETFGSKFEEGNFIKGVGRLNSALLAAGQELRLVIDWGDDQDPFASGTVTLSSVEIEVIAVTNETFNFGANPPQWLFKEVTQTLDMQIGANPARELTLNRNGALPFLFVYNLNNGARNDAVLNRLIYRRNAQGILMDQSWIGVKQEGAALFGTRTADIVDGTGMVVFDRDGDFSAALALADPEVFESFRLVLDHDVYTTSVVLLHHHFYVEPALAA